MQERAWFNPGVCMQRQLAGQQDGINRLFVGLSSGKCVLGRCLFVTCCVRRPSSIEGPVAAWCDS